MKQKSFSFQDSYDAVTYLGEIKDSKDYLQAKSVLIMLYTDRNNKEYIAYILNLIKKRLPKAQIAGLTCVSSFAHGEELFRGTVVTTLFFYHSEVEVASYDFSRQPHEAVLSDLQAKLQATENLKGIQVYTTPMKNTVTNRILSALSRAFENLPVFGAGAGWGEKATNKELYVFSDSIIENGMVVTIFKGKQLQVYAESTLGWTPIGKQMTVTGVTDDCILETVDGESAGEVYKKYLGVVSEENFIENTCEFPFMMKRGEYWIARVPKCKDKNGNVQFTADIAIGDRLFFSYGSKKLILSQSFNLADYLIRKNLEGIIIHVCRNRKIFLKDEETLALHAFSSFYREASGCFAFSEILYRGENGGILNSSLIAIGFLEVSESKQADIVDDCFIEDMSFGRNRFVDLTKVEADFPRNSSVIPFEDRIVHFFHAITQDLNQANAKLEELATTDGLTKLYNRKKISECIEHALSNRREERGIHLIMFDIDNFKHINDTYGHDRGDEVLRTVAQTARNCLRSKDTIGRWGGEEFMILVTDAEKIVAVEIAERIRSSINSLVWENMPPVSVSIGVSQLRSGDDSETLYKRVDNHLYYAKTHGKNQVVSTEANETK